MKLCTIREGNQGETAAIYLNNGIVPLAILITQFNLPKHWTTIKAILPELDELQSWYNSHEEEISELKSIPLEEVSYGPLFRDPGKIWGIGLNYRDHAGDLDEKVPDVYPGSFMKPSTTVIGYGDHIKIPTLSERTTGEGELGIIIKKRGRDIDKAKWMEYVAGFTTIIDMTAEDILRKNPRYLTLCKSFDTFFSFGPVLITADEFTEDQILNLTVSTVLNEKIIASNKVRNMTYPPPYLVSFHSQVMTLNPGDIISTGTPKAVHINHKDTVTCRIDGFPDLKNPVIDLKVEN